jgi:hypothetical protein
MDPNVRAQLLAQMGATDPEFGKNKEKEDEYGDPAAYWAQFPKGFRMFGKTNKYFKGSAGTAQFDDEAVPNMCSVGGLDDIMGNIGVYRRIRKAAGGESMFTESPSNLFNK